VKELPLDDRPREKLILRGAQSLSDAELIAILLRTGKKGMNVIEVARSLLKKHGNIAYLASRSLQVLKQTDGIGKDKAATLIAAFELSKRIGFYEKTFYEKRITSPEEVAEVFIPLLRNELKEKFFVICLNTANKIIKYEMISEGNLDSSVVHPREVYKVAIENNSKSIILLHNHPSGNAEPSNEDLAITKKISEAGKILDIPVFDHIIIAENNYVSFIEKRLL